MGMIARFLAPREERALTATEAIRRMLTATVTRSGVAVTEQSALQLMAVFTAVRIISETFAQVPLKLYRIQGDGARKEARDHPLWKVLHDQPNDEMTSFTLREVMMGHLLTWGNTYLEISRNWKNEVIGLWPLLPNLTYPKRTTTGELVYITRIQRDPANVQSVQEVVLPARNVLHIPGLGFDGLRGYSVIGTVRESIGLGFAYDSFGSYFFGNNATPGFMLTTNQTLKKEYVDDLERKIKEGHEGLSNSQRLMILTAGLKPERIGISPEDSQFIESRKFSRDEIFGLYRIPPPLTGDTEKASAWGSGMQELKIAFVTYTMMPWFKRVEQAINMKLLGANSQAPIFPEFDVNGLTRGDFKTRMEAYSVGRQWGWLSVNDIRMIENEPSIGKQGDVYLQPMNMQSAQKALDAPMPDPTPPTATPAPTEETPPNDNARGASFRRALADAYIPMLTDVAERALRREKADVARGVEKALRSGADLEAWADTFYAEHRKWLVTQITPALTTLSESVRADVSREIGREVERAPIARFARSFTDGMVERFVSETEGVVRAALTTPAEVSRVTEALEARGQRIATREARRAVSAVAATCYRESDTPMRWVSGDDCLTCAALDGAVVRGQPFHERIGHPPACDDCECVVVAATGDAPLVPETRRDERTMMLALATLATLATREQAPSTVTVNVPAQAAPIVNIAEGAIQHRSEAPVINVAPPVVNINEGAVKVETHAAPVNVTTPAVNVSTPPVNVTVEAPAQGDLAVERDKNGNLIGIKRKGK